MVAPAPAPVPAPAPSPTPASAPEPGYKTSEGWLAFLVGLTSLVPSTLLANTTPVALQVAGIVGAVLVTIMHSWNRTSLKKAHVYAAATTVAPAPLPAVAASSATPGAPAAQAGCVRLPVILALAALAIGGLLFASCAGAQKMTGAFAACARADLNQAIDPAADPALAGLTGADLLSFVTEIVTRNAAELEAQLAAVAAIATLDAVDCAIAAIEAVQGAPAQPVQATAAAPPAEVARAKGIARARAWVNAQRTSAGSGSGSGGSKGGR